MPASENVIKALAVACELTGTELSPAAARVLVNDLAKWPEPQVLAALERCRRELHGRLTLAAVLERIDDGRPGVEEAFAMLPKSEDDSVFWTDEMREASRGVLALLKDGDRVTARMAFKERYTLLVQRNRDRGVPVCWSHSPGNDSEAVLLEAVERGRLKLEHARALLPHLEAPASSEALALITEKAA